MSRIGRRRREFLCINCVCVYCEKKVYSNRKIMYELCINKCIKIFWYYYVYNIERRNYHMISTSVNFINNMHIYIIFIYIEY